MNNIPIPALEVIDNRLGVSPFAQELASIFQECIDYRETIPTLTERITKVKDYFIKVSIPKLKKCVYKHTNIPLVDVHVSDYPDIGYACIMQMGDKEGLTSMTIIDRYCGQVSDPYMLDYMKNKKVTPRTADEFQKIADSVNRKEAIIKNTALPDGYKCAMVLYFDPYSAFLVKESMSVHCEYMSAYELTGIVLHEVGHMFTTLAHSADKCFRIQVYNNAADYFMNNASTREKLKFLKNNAKKYVKDKKQLDKYNQIIGECTAILDSKDHDDAHWTAFLVVSTVQVMLYTLIGILESLIPRITILGITFGSIYRTIQDNNEWNPKKHSDMFRLPKAMAYCEQLADEFVIRHGIGPYHVNALNKIFKYNESVGFAFSRTSVIQYYTSKMLICWGVLFGVIDTSGDGFYDSIADRTDRILEQMNTIFKNPDISPKLAKCLLEDYYATKRNAKNTPNLQSVEEFRKNLSKIHEYIVGSFLAILRSGRFPAEYVALYKKLETLQANKLYTRAYDFQNRMSKI